MKLLQRILIIAILLLPIAAGIFVLYGGKRAVSSTALKRLGLVRIEGVIMDSESIIKQLRLFRMDHSVAGIILRVDSPGGATAPSQEIYQEIMRIKQAGKPLIVSMGNVAASGGYYVASPANRIFADPGTLTGSIGVIMSIPLYADLANKIGVQMRTYKAGKYKDIGNSFRQMSNNEEQILQSLLDDTHNQFISDVAEARGMNRDSIAAIADGRIFTGRQAIKFGLVDTLGGYQDALGYLRYLTGSGPNVRVVERGEKLSVIREWLVEEIVHIFPQVYNYLSPYNMQYLFSFN